MASWTLAEMDVIAKTRVVGDRVSHAGFRFGLFVLIRSTLYTVFCL